MSYRVVTMSDSNYFDCGKLFIGTRRKVDADFVLYGPDLDMDQLMELRTNNIDYSKLDKKLFRERMQFLKFDLLLDQINIDKDCEYDGFSLVDFDTFFINDWKNAFDHDFDIGVTVRNDMVRKKCLRAYANGGVVFVKRSAARLLNYAKDTIIKGGYEGLPEYDTIWKTLENGRPKHKTHYRTELRWWVDQVFLSSLVLRYFETNGYHKIGLEPVFFDFGRFKVGLFSCNYYNVLESKPIITKEKNVYIRHLKTTGRNSLGVNKTVEKL